MAINYNSLPSEKSSQFAVIPKGNYIAKIVKSEMKTPKTGKKDYFSAECDVTDPATNQSMGKFWINLYDSESNLPLFQIKRFIDAIGLKISGEFDLKDLTKMVNGKSLLVDICPDDEGKRSVVDVSADCFYPLELNPSRAEVDSEITDVFTAPMAEPMPGSEPVPAVSASY